ncbi:MAG: hypothetical protein ACMV0K_12490 [Sulfurospirillum sp.]|jgi:hypothetical protein
MNIDGPTIALILSILGLLATLFLYKLGNDVRKIRIKKQRITYKERFYTAVQKRWKEPYQQENQGA